ncbi:MAG: hypothetical protein Q4E22_06525 [Coriobacteriia bacterium]|nr:hypothetical protein [Coriobacteriia bacterium]
MASAYWIQHDNNARSSLKIKNAALDLSESEELPYAVAFAIVYSDFFRLLEVFDNEGDFIDLSNKYEVVNIANELYIDKDTLLKRLALYVEHGLFDKEFYEQSNKIGSNGFIARKLEQSSRSEKAKKAVQARWAKQQAQ